MKTGDSLPLFRLPDQDGNIVNIADYIGKKNLIIYFYPADNTFGCTRESCAFRDVYPSVVALDAEIIGISKDNVSSHNAFIQSYQLPFILLSDVEGKVHDLFDIGRTLFGIVRERITFVIDKSGTIIHVYKSILHFRGHVEESIRALSHR